MNLTWIAKTFLFCLAMALTSVALAELAVPSLSARITDLTDTLTSKQKATLERSLANFEAQKGAQIAVLIIPTTTPEAIEQYSLRVVEQWKLGRKKVDDGALLLIAKDDRALRIEVGYGLEGALNDAVSKRIISEIIVPRFKQDDYYGGIEAGINSMMKVINGEPLPKPKRDSSDFDHYLPIIFIGVLVIGGILRTVLGRLPAALLTGGITTVAAWVLIGALSISIFAGVMAFIVILFGGGLGRGHYGGGPGRRGGGGGFGGGGGGGFGGGGASGKW